MTACPRFPPEISDYIVDIVHSGGQAETLKRCCLVSKSWVPRTRKHLFATVEIWGVRDVRAWKTVFPNPSNSPAHYARSLFFNSMEPINDVVAEEDGWIRAFQNVVRLELQNVLMIYPSQQLQVLSLICSLPLLEDLVIRFSGALGWEGGNETVLHPLTPPPLTGTLETYRFQGIEHFIPRLLDQLKGVHFRKLECWWDSEEDIQRAVTCVDACSNTLEYVDVCSLVHGSSSATSIDFSKAKELKKVTFRSGESSIVWISAALKTITVEHKNFREIFISIRFNFIPFVASNPENTEQTSGEELYRQWMDLDHLLVRLSESHGARVMVKYYSEKKKEALEFIGGALPEMVRRGNTMLD